MSEESTVDTYTVSFKSGQGYDASLLVVRGDNVAELDENIVAVQEELLNRIVETEDLFHAVKNASVLTQPQQVQQPAQVATVTQFPQQPQAPVQQVKTCNHGVRVYKSGKNTRGEWEAWYCPQPRNAPDRCEPVYGN